MSDKKFEFRIVDHGYDHNQYFPGHGVAFSRYTHTETGQGDNAETALADALDMLAQSYPELSEDQLNEIEASEDYRSIAEDRSDVYAECACDDDQVCKRDTGEECDGCAVCAGDWYRYISIDFRLTDVKEG